MKRNLSEFKEFYRGHKNPVIAVLCNEKFKQIVTVDELSIFTWDMDDGDLLFKFNVVCYSNLKFTIARRKELLLQYLMNRAEKLLLRIQTVKFPNGIISMGSCSKFASMKRIRKSMH